MTLRICIGYSLRSRIAPESKNHDLSAVIQGEPQQQQNQKNARMDKDEECAKCCDRNQMQNLSAQQLVCTSVGDSRMRRSHATCNPRTRSLNKSEKDEQSNSFLCAITAHRRRKRNKTVEANEFNHISTKTRE